MFSGRWNGICSSRSRSTRGAPSSSSSAPPPPPPQQPILQRFAELGGLEALLNKTLRHFPPASASALEYSEDELAIRNWLLQIEHDLPIPGLACAVMTNAECMAILIGVVQQTSSSSAPVSLCLLSFSGGGGGQPSHFDLYLAYVHALTSLFSSAEVDDNGMLLKALEHGVIDRLLLWLGEMQAEEPRRPEYARQFQFPKQQQQPSYPSAGVGAAVAASTSTIGGDQSKALWRPGYGTGSGNTTARQDAEREFQQAGKRSVSVAICKCLTGFIRRISFTAAAAASTAWPLQLLLLRNALESSCLLRVYLAYFFQTTSQAVMANSAMNKALLELARAIASSGYNGVCGVLFLEDSTTTNTVYSLLQGAQRDVAFDDEDQDERELGAALASTCVQAGAALERITAAAVPARLPAPAAAAAAEEEEEEEEASAPAAMRYQQLMRPELFKDMDMRTTTTSSSTRGEYPSHHFYQDIAYDAKHASAGAAKTRQRRVNRELKALQSTLPLHFGSTVALRVDRTRPFVLKFIVFAPSNTPYDSGAFLFDMFLGSDFPNEPPKVNLETTGAGQVRFNPNLYANGKVCLSILGTWQGGANGSENWKREQSTLLQVLVSIQSAILGSEFPYFNEPSLEQHWGTSQGELQKRVNANGGYERLRVATLVHAMTEQLARPPEGFEDCVRIHFREKRDYIMHEVCPLWLADAAKSDTKGHLASLQQAVKDLTVALNKL